jgi:hypothetical protein
MIPVRTNKRAVNNTAPVVINSFGGVDKSTTDTEIDLRHSPGMIT